MKKILFFTLLFTQALFSQEKVNLTENGVSVVTSIEGLSSDDLKTKTKKWILTYYQNPDEVIKAEMDNSIRLYGACTECLQYSVMVTHYYTVMYNLEISFKDGRYKFDLHPTDLFYSRDGSRPMFNLSSFYRKKDGSVRSSYKKHHESLQNSIQAIYDSLYDYLTGKTENSKLDW